MGASTPIGTGPLIGRFVRLDPLVEADVPSLFAALDDPRVYASGYGGGPTGQPADAARFRQSIVDPVLAMAAQGLGQPYTVRSLDAAVAPVGSVVGTSTLGDIRLGEGRIHLGWTGYAPSVWGGVVNPECKYLLLGQAFGLGFRRVKIQTDLINLRSQAAIAKLGATREGVLRRHKVRADGSFRDTVVFSILDVEWPDVAAHLEERLATGGAPAPAG